MKHLIIYDSESASIPQLAKAVAKGMQLENPENLIKIKDLFVDNLYGLEFLIVGSPTIGFHPSTAIARWLENLPPHALDGIKAAAFDTRSRMNDQLPFVRKMFLSGYGYAASHIVEMLSDKGAKIIVSPQGFITDNLKGKLAAGETVNAFAWGVKLNDILNRRETRKIRIKKIKYNQNY